MTNIDISSSIKLNNFAKLSIIENLKSRDAIHNEEVRGIKLFFTEVNQKVRAIIEVYANIKGSVKKIIKNASGSSHLEAYATAVEKALSKYDKLAGNDLSRSL
ncbi:MAG: hypothetical protein ACI9P5_003787 [Saprospiraceae bacterium]|jgi:hypothetical protein|tara:strand:+ start:129 stop:437 length:309 start_codon:yes stop_codon:yes gene_type:complete